MLLVLSEEYKEHLAFLPQVDPAGNVLSNSHLREILWSIAMSLFWAFSQKVYLINGTR
jgi:hypothetical protein